MSLNHLITHLASSEYTKSDDHLIDVSSFLNTDLPQRIQAQLNTFQVKIRHFDKENEIRIKKQDLIQRLDSIFEAAFPLLALSDPNFFEKLKKLTELKEQFPAKLRSYFKGKIKNLRNENKLGSLNNEFQDFLEDEIYPELLPLLRQPNETIEEVLKRLRETEIKKLSGKNRPSYLNIDKDGYFSMEIPLGIDDKGDPYTLQSYDRAGPLANWTLHLFGYIDDQGQAMVLNQQTRNASYCAIDIKESATKRMQGTITAVTQQVDAQKELYTSEKSEKRAFHQLSLLSPVHSNFSAMDEQKQYQQTLETFVAFNIVNQTKEDAELHYFAQGVNGFNADIISDPLKDWINTRYLNQLFDKSKDHVDRLSTQSNLSDKAKVLLGLYQKLFAESENVKNMKEAIDDSWTKIQDTFTKINQLINSNEKNKEHKYQNTINILLKQLKEHHSLENKLKNYYETNWRNHKETIERHQNQLLAQVAEKSATPETKEVQHFCQHLYNLQWLYYTKNYGDKKYNYEIHDSIAGILSNLGERFGINCNDGEDRTGRAIVTIDAANKVQFEKGYVPNITLSPQLEELKAQQTILLPTNVCINNTSQVPGAAGLEVHACDGNEHLNHKEGVYGAQLAKLPYKLSFTTNLKDSVTMRVDSFSDAIKNIYKKMESFSKKVGLFVALSTLLTAVGFASDNLNNTDGLNIAIKPVSSLPSTIQNKKDENSTKTEDPATPKDPTDLAINKGRDETNPSDSEGQLNTSWVDDKDRDEAEKAQKNGAPQLSPEDSHKRAFPPSSPADYGKYTQLRSKAIEKSKPNAPEPTADKTIQNNNKTALMSRRLL